MKRNIKKYFPIFLLPITIAFAFAFVIPFSMGVGLSFTEFTAVTDAKWVGFQNYISAFSSSSDFLHALGFTALFTVVSVVTVNVFSFALALLLTRGIRGTNLFRSVFFMPNLIGGIVLGYIWNLLINAVLSSFGVDITCEDLQQLTKQQYPTLNSDVFLKMQNVIEDARMKQDSCLLYTSDAADD